jgi:hypothetical protein
MPSVVTIYTAVARIYLLLCPGRLLRWADRAVHSVSRIPDSVHRLLCQAPNGLTRSCGKFVVVVVNVVPPQLQPAIEAEPLRCMPYYLVSFDVESMRYGLFDRTDITAQRTILEEAV